MTVRLGAIGFLNTRPLTAGLEDEPQFELSYSVPSACAAELRRGRLDAGLLPSVEYARGPELYRIVPQVAIASRGEVLTVRLFCRKPLPQVARIALDLNSLSSVALLRILLREKYGLDPELVDAAPDLTVMLERADAALLIGDSVFAHLDSPIESLDLGAEWTGLTGLPFVFAFWAGLDGALSPAQAQSLVRAARRGRERVPAIARAFAAEREGAAELYERYLTQHIRFDLGADEMAGLHEFYTLAHRNGLVDAVPELRFFEIDG